MLTSFHKLCVFPRKLWTQIMVRVARQLDPGRAPVAVDIGDDAAGHGVLVGDARCVSGDGGPTSSAFTAAPERPKRARPDAASRRYPAPVGGANGAAEAYQIKSRTQAMPPAANLGGIRTGLSHTPSCWFHWAVHI
jgi:hypothetical protein